MTMKQPNETTGAVDPVLDNELRQALLAHKTQREFTNKDLARALGAGADGTRISKYLNGRPDGDWLVLQTRARDYLQAEAKKAAIAPTELRETLVTKMCFGIIELTRKLNEFAVIDGPAGVGKTCAGLMWVDKNPNTLHITATQWCKDESTIIGAILDAYGRKHYDNRTSRAQWLVDRMRGTARLLLIDNAQRLTINALKFIIDFHDLTGCPVVLMGNKEILEKLRGSDQLFSRIQASHTVSFEQIAEAEQFAAQMLRDHLPSGVEVLRAEVTELLLGPGAGRRVNKQLKLTRELLHCGEFTDPRKAFAAARLKMLTKGGR